MNKQTDKPSTSHETIIDCDNPRYDSNVSNKKLETLSSRSRPRAFPGENENDGATHSPSDIKIRTWLHTFPDKPSTDDWIVGNEIPIEDKGTPLNPISDDNGKSDGTGEVYHDGIDANRRPSQGRKRSTDCPKRIDEDDTMSQVNKRMRQIGEVIEIDSDSASGLKYNVPPARIRAKKSCEKIARSKSDIEETVNQGNSSSTTEYDRIAASAPQSLSTTSTSAITEQSTANWSRVIQIGKEMKRGKKRNVKKLNVSTEKNRNPPRIVDNIRLSPNSRYDSGTIAATHNKSEKETNISSRLESNDRKQDAIDKSLHLSDTKAKSLTETNSQTELCDKDKSDNSKSTYSTMNTSYITLEEGRKVHIMSLNDDQMSKIIGFENTAEDPQNRRREENTADYRDSLLSPRKRLTVLTPEKLNESIHEAIHDFPVSSGDYRSSSCLSAEKRTPGPRETSNVQKTSSGAVSSRSSTPIKISLSLRKNLKTGDNNSTKSPQLSQLPLSHRLSVAKHGEDIGDRKSVDSPVSMEGEPFDRLKAVRRDLNFKIIREDQQRTDRDTVSSSIRLKSIIEVEDNDGNVSGIVCQDGKFSRNFTGESATSKKSVPKSRSIENRGHQSSVKFMQLGTLIKRRNIKYFFLGKTKHELSMPAQVQVTPVCNMQQSVSTSEVHVVTSSDPWNDSQNSSNIAVENVCFANNSNSDQAVSPTCEASATSTPKRDKSIENVAEENTRYLHQMSHAESAIRRISHTRSGTSNSIKLLSPDKDSQLKFLTIDSPISEREELRRARSIKSAIKGNNFSEMESSLPTASTLDKVRKSPIESASRRKRMRCASDVELFEDGPSDGNDDSNDSVSDSSRITIKRDGCSKLSEKAISSRLDANKKRRLSSPNDQDVDVIPSVSKEQDAPGKTLKTSSSDTESESAMHVTKNLKRY